MVVDDALASAVMLAMALGAVHFLLREGRGPPAEPPGAPPAADPLRFTPEIRRQVDLLRDTVCAPTGSLGQADRVELLCRRFAMLAYRRIGRDPQRTSRLDAQRAAEDLTLIRADIVNALQALYITAHREKYRARLDGIVDVLLTDTDAYVRAVRAAVGHLNLYEGGRGFPRPWRPDADPNYDLLV